MAYTEREVRSFLRINGGLSEGGIKGDDPKMPNSGVFPKLLMIICKDCHTLL